MTVGPETQTTRRLTVRSRSGAIVAPLQVLVSFFVLLAAWEGYVRAFDVSRLVLPAPTTIVDALQRGWERGLYPPHLWFTLQETIYGFLVALAIALPLGTLLVSARLLERLAMPYLVALQAMPKIALGPLFVTWLGIGMQSKIAVAALVAFFPLLVNVMSGLRSAPSDMHELMTALGASRMERIRMVLVPSAAPYIFAGMSVAVVFALLGAIAAEFVGSSQGLGVLLLTSAANFDIAGVFAILIMLSAIGIVLYGAVEFARRRIVFWVG